MSKYLKWIACAVMLPLFGLWCRALVRDTKLTVPSDNSGKKWELGGISSVRRIGDDVWDITADNVVRDIPIERLKGVAAQINGPSGLRTVNSPKGEYDNKAVTLLLYDAYGKWHREDGVIDWQTPEAHWSQKDDEWNFPHGITADNGTYYVTGATASFRSQSKVHLTDGCVRWYAK